MPSFGEKLKREREKRAITLEQISSSTKIGTRMLQALEGDDFDQLPGGIFNKGFVRAYARHVGLDEDETVAGYLEASGQNGIPKADAPTDSTPPADDTSPSSPPGRAPLGWLAVALLIVALALTLWSRRHHNTNAPPAANQQASSSTAAPTSRPATVSSSNNETVALSSASLSPAQATPPVLKPASANVSLPVSPIGEFTVLVQAREDSWVSITADGKLLFEDTLITGNERAVHAKNEVTIKAGNTGALDFIFSGKKLPLQGDYGEVKTLTFAPGGLLPRTPSSTLHQ